MSGVCIYSVFQTPFQLRYQRQSPGQAGHQTVWVQISSMPLVSSDTLDEPPEAVVPQFPQLYTRAAANATAHQNHWEVKRSGGNSPLSTMHAAPLGTWQCLPLVVFHAKFIMTQSTRELRELFIISFPAAPCWIFSTRWEKRQEKHTRFYPLSLPEQSDRA